MLQAKEQQGNDACEAFIVEEPRDLLCLHYQEEPAQQVLRTDNDCPRLKRRLASACAALLLRVVVCHLLHHQCMEHQKIRNTRTDSALAQASFCLCQDVRPQSESTHKQMKHRLQKSSGLKYGCCVANVYLGCLVALSIYTFCNMITDVRLYRKSQHK